MDFAGKRILITHSIARSIMGSTVVALELGEHLVQSGADVNFYAFAILTVPLAGRVLTTCFSDSDSAFRRWAMHELPMTYSTVFR